MKRIITLILCAALISACFTGCGKTVRYAENPQLYEKNLEYHEGFTILQLTDIHWNGATQIGDENYGSEEYIRKVINEAVNHAGQIDLIEITGDTFMLSNAIAVKEFIDMMGEIGIPYAMTWGNHDRENDYNPNWLSRQFMEAPCSLYTEVDNDDVHERSNYVINLTEDGKTVWQIIQLDSGASYRRSAADMSLTYDYMREDQFSWMTFMHERAGSDVPALCYYHIPQAEVEEAYKAIQAGDTGYKYKFFKMEEFCPSEYAANLDDLLKKNNVRGAFFGHDHSVDFTYTNKDGIVLGFGVKTGRELYGTTITPDYKDSGVEVTESFDLIGASLVTLNDTEGDFTLEHLYLNERDGGDFVMWVEY